MFNAVIGRMGFTELLVVLLIVLVIFGPTQLPKLSKTLGRTITSFKKGMDEELNREDVLTSAEKDEQKKESSAE